MKVNENHLNIKTYPLLYLVKCHYGRSVVLVVVVLHSLLNTSLDEILNWGPLQQIIYMSFTQTQATFYVSHGNRS